ncbi:MAG TPA: hypothetical protein VD905_11110 [Flavobacteriales bacterium]|nr:hypothetical protein [Flavobacteriales bacterium]
MQTIRANKTRTGVLLVIVLGIIVFDLWIIFRDNHRNWAQPPVDRTQNWILFGILLVVLVFLFLRAFDRKPALELDDEKLTCNLGLFEKGQVKWNAIRAIEKTCIQDSNRRKLDQLSIYPLSGKTINIIADTISCTFDELHDMIMESWKKARNRC